MPQTHSISGGTPILPPTIVALVKRWARQIRGLSLILGAIALSLALFSYQVGDSSLNTASDAIANWLGWPGALVADLLMQSVGLAGLLPVPVLLAWGWLVMDGEGLSYPPVRILGVIVAQILLAMFLAGLPVPESWPLRAGLGGVAGAVSLDGIAGGVLSLLSHDGAELIPVHGIVSALALALGLFTVLRLLGLRRRHWRALRRHRRRTQRLLRVIIGRFWQALAHWRENQRNKARIRRFGRQEPRLNEEPVAAGHREPVFEIPVSLGHTAPIQARVEQPVPAVESAVPAFHAEPAYHAEPVHPAEPAYPAEPAHHAEPVHQPEPLVERREPLVDRRVQQSQTAARPPVDYAEPVSYAPEDPLPAEYLAEHREPVAYRNGVRVLVRQPAATETAEPLGPIAYRNGVRVPPQMVERELAARELAARELAARELAEREQAERHLAERDLAELEMAEREMAERELAAMGRRDETAQRVATVDIDRGPAVEQEDLYPDLVDNDLADDLPVVDFPDPEPNFDDHIPYVPEPRAARVTPPPPPGKAKKSAPVKAYQPALKLGNGPYELPPLALLTEAPVKQARSEASDQALEQNARLLESVLEDFGVRGSIVKVRPGPVVTLYELEPAPGTKTSRVVGLADDIARSMSAVSVRVAVIPGRNVIGIELPNRSRETVFMREMLEADAYKKQGGALTLALGKDIGGEPMAVDLARMPHLLIAGTTGSGKSVAVNTMILSLLYNHPPEECRLIMIDPKMLELSVYDDIPHLLAPVVTDPNKAVVALKWAVREMEDRYRAMAQLGVRNISGYNKRLKDARRKGEVLTRRVQTGFDDDGQPIHEEQPLSMEALPYIVVIVDEMADLMLVAGKDIEAAIQRLAQMARAAGIHLIMATQRPSVDVITGTIKANFPTRISFQVTSKIDSRTILGEQGAEQLLGQGDMLYMAGGGRITRVHGPFVSDEEVEEVVAHLKAQAAPEYVESVTEESDDAPPILGMEGSGGAAGGGSAEDQLYDQAVALVAREGKASTSFVQRHLQIGYNRAARLIERMEAEGVVSKANRVGKREVLVGHHGD